MSPQLSLSLFDLVQAQAQRLQSVSDELLAAKRALHERKQIERAKGILMTHRGLTEEQAYKMLRQSAMDQSRRMVDVAEAILNMADLLQEKRQINIPVIQFVVRATCAVFCFLCTAGAFIRIKAVVVCRLN